MRRTRPIARARTSARSIHRIMAWIQHTQPRSRSCEGLSSARQGKGDPCGRLIRRRGSAIEKSQTNLPLQLTSFIGREREITEAKRLLAATRLLTLTGAGGCGKTRLALQVASKLLDAFPDGVWFVDLAPLSDPALVPQTVASVFDLHETAETPFINILQNYFHTKNLLLVLDNCEHLIQACAELCNTLLRACPDLKILATSREALNIAGETAFRVPSLALPDPQQLPPLEILSQYDSIRLFIERAQAARSDFQLSDANARAISQICQRLDGIPLAIELATARVKALSLDQIAAHLGDHFRLLTGGSRTAALRQQTLRATMDWSYELLSEQEKILLRRLSVFAGGWSLEAAEFIARDGYSVIDTQSRLVDQSLVLARETEDGAVGYHLLEPIRQYAQDKLLESGEVEQVRSRHLDFFLKFAEDAKPKLHSAEQLKLLNRRRTEYENLRAALEWARGAGSPVSNRGELNLRIIGALDHLGDVYRLTAGGTLAISQYQEAIALWHRLGNADKMSVLSLHGKIVEIVSGLQWSVDLPRFEAMNQIGIASQKKIEAEPKFAEGDTLHPEMIRLLTILSKAAWRMRVPPDWDAAERYARDAVDMAEKLNDPIELSRALFAFSDVYFARGLLRERVKVALRRLALSRDPGFRDARQRIRVLIDTGQALWNVGEYAQAIPHFSEAESLAEQLLAVDQQKIALEQRAYCLFCLDRWDDMLKIGEQLENIQRRYPREQIGSECFRIALGASVHARRGEFGLSEVGREESRAIMNSLGGALDRWGRAQLY